MVWLWFKTRPTPVPYLATSSVAPAPCFAHAQPCLDVWWGEPFLVQRPLCWPACLSGTHGRCRAQEITVWCFKPPLALGSGGAGHRPPWGSVPSRLPRFSGRLSCSISPVHACRPAGAVLSASACSAFVVCTPSQPLSCARAPPCPSRCRRLHYSPSPCSSPSQSCSSFSFSSSGHTHRLSSVVYG